MGVFLSRKNVLKLKYARQIKASFKAYFQSNTSTGENP